MGHRPSYVRALNWNDLARAVRQSTSRSSLDEMVQLYHRLAPQENLSPRHVRRVVFTRTEDIVPSLSNSQYLHFRNEDVDLEDLKLWKEGVVEDGRDVDDGEDAQAVDVRGITKKIDANQPELIVKQNLFKVAKQLQQIVLLNERHQQKHVNA